MTTTTTTTIKCKVVADKVWDSKENRFRLAGEVMEFPAQVKNHEGKLVDFKIGDSFELVKEEKPAKTGKPTGNGAPADLA